MGVYGARGIAEYHGGSAKASNLLNGKGVTIRIKLPLYKPVRQKAVAAS